MSLSFQIKTNVKPLLPGLLLLLNISKLKEKEYLYLKVIRYGQISCNNNKNLNKVINCCHLRRQNIDGTT